MAVAAAAGAIAFCAPPSVRAEQGSFAQIERGRYLAAAGDCAGCHTAEGGRPMAGGRALQTPFGVIYTPNITPDAATGIGAWTDDQFYRAMHEGIAADGTHLYPAFPYPWFTKVTRPDVDAIHAYLRTLPAVSYRRPDNKLPWPLDDPNAMIGWNALYFDAGTYTPDPGQSKAWNRGAYLVQGLGHCGACHTPTNFLGASEKSRRLQGGELSNWYAPGLAGGKRAGLGHWSAQDIVDFLRTGRTATAIAYGPMAEVVHYSTSSMTEDDLRAIAAYLKSLPPPGPPEAPDRPPAGVADAGVAIYADTCSACHGADGKGVSRMFPPLAGTAIVQSPSPTTVIRLILNGGQAVATDEEPTPVAMPSFGWKLSDEQIAAVASYVRSAWGNRASPVSASAVHAVRQAVESASSAD
jgi:mono/diheme cytochrome c family protein